MRREPDPELILLFIICSLRSWILDSKRLYSALKDRKHKYIHVSGNTLVIEKDELLPSQYLREKHAANSPLACTARTFRSQSADWLVVRVLSSLAGAVLHDHDPQSALKNPDQSIPNAEAGEIGCDRWRSLSKQG